MDTGASPCDAGAAEGICGGRVGYPVCADFFGQSDQTGGLWAGRAAAGDGQGIDGHLQAGCGRVGQAGVPGGKSHHDGGAAVPGGGDGAGRAD